VLFSALGDVAEPLLVLVDGIERHADDLDVALGEPGRQPRCRAEVSGADGHEIRRMRE
jgi:hypothetical protein